MLANHNNVSSPSKLESRQVNHMFTLVGIEEIMMGDRWKGLDDACKS